MTTTPAARRRPGILAILGLACALAAPGRAAAEPQTVVLLVQQDGGEDARALVRIVTDSLRGLQVRLVVEPVPALPADRAARVALADRLGRSLQARAVVFCDFGPVVEVHLYQVLAGGGRLLSRQVEGGGASSPEGRQEIIGAILLGGVDAILSGGEVGRPVAVAPRPPPPPPRRPPPPPPPPRRPERRRVPVALEAAFQVTGLAGTVFAPGGRLDLLVVVHRLVTVGLGYGASPAIHPPEKQGVELTLHHHQVHLVGTVAWPWRRLGLGVRTGMALDLEQHRAEGAGAGPDGLEVGVALEAQAVLQVQAVTWLAVTLGLGARVVIKGSRYETWDRAPIFTPWNPQPLVTLGLRFRIH